MIKKYITYLKSVWKQQSNGIGDTFKKITSTLNIKSCKECEKRRTKWNQAISYKKNKKDDKNAGK